MRTFCVMASCTALVCCATVTRPLTLPPTEGELSTGLSYIPLDGMQVLDGDFHHTCNTNSDANYLADGFEYVPLLQVLPDITSRFAVATGGLNGGLNFGASKITTQGQNYAAILDYVNVEALPQDVLIRGVVNTPATASGSGKFVSVYYPPFAIPFLKDLPAGSVIGYEALLVDDLSDAKARELLGSSTLSNSNKNDIGEMISAKTEFEKYTFLVFVGVGLRVSAEIEARKGGISLSGLGQIGVEASANNLTGTLSVQTIGISGPEIGTALPLPNKLDQTTVENALLAIGLVRGELYSDKASIVRTPRIVGMQSPLGSNPSLIAAVHSELAGYRKFWDRPCRPKKTKNE